MNERIKELLKQATTTHLSGMGEWDEVDHEKFAELIVRECLSNIEDCDGDLDFAIWKIKKDFGVKE